MHVRMQSVFYVEVRRTGSSGRVTIHSSLPSLTKNISCLKYPDKSVILNRVLRERTNVCDIRTYMEHTGGAITGGNVYYEEAGIISSSGGCDA